MSRSLQRHHLPHHLSYHSITIATYSLSAHCNLILADIPLRCLSFERLIGCCMRSHVWDTAFSFQGNLAYFRHWLGFLDRLRHLCCVFLSLPWFNNGLFRHGHLEISSWGWRLSKTRVSVAITSSSASNKGCVSAAFAARLVSDLATLASLID